VIVSTTKVVEVPSTVDVSKIVDVSSTVNVSKTVDVNVVVGTLCRSLVDATEEMFG
jgi:hypothetical protein